MKLKELFGVEKINESVDLKNVTFTKEELLKVFKHFLNRLVTDFGNDRNEMIKFHIEKLVGLPYSQVIQKMPRGPKGRWENLMVDIKDELKELATEKSQNETDILESREYDWAILPATMALYNKKVVDIITAASEWKESLIYVCSKTESSGKGRILFVASPGGNVGAKVGESYNTIHDQTRASKGRYKVLNIVRIEDGKIVSKENDVGLDVKASLAVFK